MAFIGLKVPHEIGRLLAQIDYGGHGKPESTDTFHITVAYFGDELPIEKLAGIIMAAFKVTSGTKPFTVQTSRVSVFPPHPEHGTVPVICRMDSTSLHDLRNALLRQFDADDVEYDKKFKEFRPHVTLAYTEPGDGAEEVTGLDLTIPTIEWGVGELVLWGGDEGDNTLVVTFPFALAPSPEPPKREALHRAMVRAALWHHGANQGLSRPRLPCR
jgi:2'-5' RNA ligase